MTPEERQRIVEEENLRASIRSERALKRWAVIGSLIFAGIMALYFLGEVGQQNQIAEAKRVQEVGAIMEEMACFQVQKYAKWNYSPDRCITIRTAPNVYEVNLRGGLTYTARYVGNNAFMIERR